MKIIASLFIHWKYTLEYMWKAELFEWVGMILFLIWLINALANPK